MGEAIVARVQKAAPEQTVDVAIVSWNTAAAAIEASRAYSGSVGVSVLPVIVDNRSEDDDRAILRGAADHGLEVVLSDENAGFGTAANGVLASGTAPFVCVSNADVSPDPGAMAELCRVAAEEPKAGMVGPVFEPPGSGYHAELPKPWALAGRPFVGGLGHRAATVPAGSEVIPVGQPAGACFVMRREVWDEVGGFDEDFFLWYEDVDLAKRLSDLGYQNLVAGGAHVRHVEALATGSLHPRRHQALRLDSLERYVGKHHPRLRPVGRPILALARRLRAGGHTPESSG